MALNHPDSVSESFTPCNAPGNEDRLKDIAKEHLGETDELKEGCLEHLRRLIKYYNLPCITTDHFLLRFLRTKKFDVPRSFEVLRNYCNQRVALHKLLQKFQPETLKSVLRDRILGILPQRDAEERLIIYHKTGVWNPSAISDEEVVVAFIVLLNFLAEKQSSQVSGVILIIDGEYLPLLHVSYLMKHIGVIKNVFFDGFPLRYKNLHCVNESFLVKYAIRLLYPVIPKKLKERILFHGKSREVLFQHFSPTILPDDIGGNLGPLSNEHLVEEMESYLKKMKYEQRYFLEKNPK